jgi:hypothetical protein
MIRVVDKKGIIREQKTVEAMIRIYCISIHHQKELCEKCSKLMEYSKIRIEKCRFGNEKPACNACTVYCYAREMRENIREVMRFSGPKMVYKHPVMALLHVLR